MPLIKFKNWRPTDDILLVVQHANQIIAELQAEGYTLTLRQLYYQFIGRGLFSENTEKQYKRLGRIVTDAREGGMMDWDAIEDRGRSCYFNAYNDDPLKLLKRIEYGLGRDPWQDQEVYLEAWIEKQSLEPVLARPCQKRRAPYMACKGYLSASEAYRAGGRFRRAIERGKRPILLHLGDHDPSGMDMTRDNGARLEMFAMAKASGVEVIRVALNMDQVKQHNPPPMPSKELDSREKGYRAKHGSNSWELDALQPRTITALILEAIDAHIDMKVWDESMAEERRMREESGLAFFAERYEELRALATSPEKPLERLAALDKALPGLLAKAEQTFHTIPQIPALASRDMRGSAVKALEEVTMAEPMATHGSAGEVCEEASKAIKALPEAVLANTHDVLRIELHEASIEVEEAMVPIPFEREGKEDEDPNELDMDLMDPDAEDQDYGLGPVRGE